MRLPKFTAEVSAYNSRGNYAGFPTSAVHPGTSSVVAQFDSTTLGNDYWAWLAGQYFSCQPPCARNGQGKCHCPRVGAPIGGPLLPPGIAR
jgi:hypothetical protein